MSPSLGISILYITHDLATAYHICDSILVLYQGTVAEAGDVDSIILNPRHPYTQLLVGSIPWPDPNRRWGEEAIISQFVMHMLHFDSAGFSRLLSEVMARYGFEEAVFRVIFPFLNKVGTFWQVGSVYPAQEHFISAMIRHQFICELERRQLEPKGEKSMLFFLHENELHELPLLYYAAVAARKGFRIIYLGPGVPLSDLEHLDVLAGVTHVLTVFTNALEHEELNTILQRLTVLLPGKEFIISGHQLKLHSLKLPEGFTLISNYHDFDAMFP